MLCRYASVFSGGDGQRTGTNDVIIEDKLSDNKWHQIDIDRNGHSLKIIVDVTRKKLSADKHLKYIDINKDITVATLPPYIRNDPQNISLKSDATTHPSLPKVSLANRAYKGCMSELKVNDVDIFRAVNEKSKLVTVSGKLEPKCTELKTESKEKLPRTTEGSKNIIYNPTKPKLLFTTKTKINSQKTRLFNVNTTMITKKRISSLKNQSRTLRINHNEEPAYPRATTKIARKQRTTKASNPSNNTHVFILERSNTVTKIGLGKYHFLVYLFLSMVFFLLVAIIVVVYIKWHHSNGYSEGLETTNMEKAIRATLETRDEHMTSQTVVKHETSSSQNDSGIDRTTSSSNSPRSSKVEEDDVKIQEEVNPCMNHWEREGDVRFLVFKDSNFASTSFDWTVVNDSQHSAVSKYDMRHSENEKVPQEYSVNGHDDYGDVTDDDVASTKHGTTKSSNLSIDAHHYSRACFETTPQTHAC